MRFFKRRPGITPPLGTLEIAVLQCFWAATNELDARAVHSALVERRITLSTVQATLERLHRKQLLARAKVGRAYRYRVVVSQEGLIGALIRDLSVQIAAGELEPVISGFMELVGDSNPELLDRLEAQAAELRKERR
jgi:predicted transcriptional regulator